MASKLVGLPDGVHLPAAVRNQLSADLMVDMATYVVDAQDAQSTAALSAITAVTAKDDAKAAVIAAEAAAALAEAPTDTMVASLVGSASDTQTALDTRYVTDADVPALIPAASTTVVGGVELATSAETITGTDAVRATTPAGVKAAINAIDSGTATVGAGYTFTDSSLTRQSRLVVYSFVIAKTTGSAAEFDVIATLPVGFRPAMGRNMPIVAFNGAYRPISANIATSGALALYINNLTGVTILSGTIVFAGA